MPVQPPPGFSWLNYAAYRSFDRFLQSLILERRSYVTVGREAIDIAKALVEINEVFVDRFDKGKEKFDEKARGQFRDASQNAKLLFVNAEYLWAMPSSSLKATTKRDYALRWFSEEQIAVDGDIYFTGDDGIANPGMYYQTNKYQEMLAIFRLLSLLFAKGGFASLAEIKEALEELCFEALYGQPATHGGFSVSDYCAAHAALLHLSAPDRFEPIFSKSHKEQVTGVFAHIIEDRPDMTGMEERVSLIRERLYGEYLSSDDPARKYRWFFYGDDIKRTWLSKARPAQQKSASINDEIYREESAPDWEEEEGRQIKTEGYRVYRSAKLVDEVKREDNYTCQACQFQFRNQIVHVHHLDPLSERKFPRKTKKDDLVTLCPNCHYLAHFFLRQKPNGSKFKNREVLMQQLQKVPR